jgi:3'(2'), 5'-bisphosphate nucleotidase
LSLVHEVLRIARAAGDAILEVYHRTAELSVSHKTDASPLTEADTAAHGVILAALARLTPGVPIVSEEDSPELAAQERLSDEYWLVDPLDGTKEFIKRTGEFTVNIAFLRSGVPQLGVVHAPVLRTSWTGDHDGAFRHDASGSTAIHVAKQASASALRIVASRDHAGPGVRALLQRLPDASTLSMGSSLKFCLIAEGRADLYFRDGPTMPWDTAAAHAVLIAAGGAIFATNGPALRYLSPRTLNPHFVALGDQSIPWASLLSPSDAP